MEAKKIKIYMSENMRAELAQEVDKIDVPEVRDFCINLIERFDGNLEKNKDKYNSLLKDTETGFEHQEVDENAEYMFIIDCPVAVKEYIQREEETFIPFSLEQQIKIRL
ncbi:MAG: hypothetical protein J6I68_14490 [Butyrivibrio sp.]|uniref:hypothetical protein n=1 Tax=Butyrivibrio sp. TaxID=28121 RepID=UPI001B614C7C|nr:hypothetical protein [Butyrivibrio sp.]MBP3784450.1 hypothetical protein [Butyrivibrio sp.]